jgi:hypothetical protein
MYHGKKGNIDKKFSGGRGPWTKIQGWVNGEGESETKFFLVTKRLELEQIAWNYWSLQEKTGGRVANTASGNKSLGKWWSGPGIIKGGREFEIQGALQPEQ